MAKSSTPRKTSRPSAQWTAQFLVASELSRRGYTVSFTMGSNTPLADLMVASPQGEHFWIDVKGQWVIIVRVQSGIKPGRSIERS